tara:strand:- start:724 stop:1467 length:744 start_codon:yes stop_codon:yes gene_type:complete
MLNKLLVLSVEIHLQNHNLYVWKDASIISIVGPDAENFLQGYITSDISKNSQNQLKPMSITDIKGRVIASGWTTKQIEGIDLIVHTSLKETVESFFAPYIRFSKSSLLTDHKRVCHSSSGLQIADGYFVELMADKSMSDVSFSKDQELLEILTKNKFVFVEARISQKFLPQQLGLHSVGAIDFDKGCYLGQEIVARVQFRGSVKKEITLTEFEKNAVCVGDKLTDGSILVQAPESGVGLAVTKAKGS